MTEVNLNLTDLFELIRNKKVTISNPDGYSMNLILYEHPRFPLTATVVETVCLECKERKQCAMFHQAKSLRTPKGANRNDFMADTYKAIAKHCDYYLRD